MIETRLLLARVLRATGTKTSVSFSSVDLAAAIQSGSTQMQLAAVIQESTPSTVVASNVKSSGPVYTVVRHDTLWGIAEKHLSDPKRWREIFDLNKGNVQIDGRKFVNADRIHAGWKLQLPADATVEQEQVVVEEPSVEHPPTPVVEEETTATEIVESNDVVGTTADIPVSSTTVVSVVADAEDSNGKSNSTRAIELTSGAIVGMTLASGVASALPMARLRRRRSYVPDDPASQISLSDGLGVGASAELQRAVLLGETTGEVDRSPGSVVIGLVDRQERSIDITELGELVIAGDEDHGVLRAIIAGFITNASDAEVVIVGSELSSSLVGDIDSFPGMRIEPDLQEVLRGLEVEIATRTRLVAEGDHANISAFRHAVPTEPVIAKLVVIQTRDERLRSWAQAIASAGKTLGIGVIFDDVANASIRVDDGSIVEATGFDADGLIGVTPFTLTVSDALDILRTLEASRSDDVAMTSFEEVVIDLTQEEPAIVLESQTTNNLVGLTVLGSPSVSVDGKELQQGLRAKAREMLVFLTLHPRGVSGEVISAKLWPDASPRSSKQNFQTALGNLRSMLRSATGTGESEAFIERTGERYRIDSSRFDCDLWRFEAGISSNDIDSLRKSVDAYRGEFAEGERFDWAYGAREQLRMSALDALGKLAKLLEESGDRDGAVRAIKGAIAIDGYNEELSRRLMTLQAKSGRSDLVMGTFRNLERRLDEIGLVPQCHTEELAYSLTTEAKSA